LEEVARDAPQLVGERSSHRLAPGESGQSERPGETGGEQIGTNPTDRGKLGSKYHFIVDRNGIALTVRLSAANAHDSTHFLPLLDAIPPIIEPRGKPGRRGSAQPSCTPTRPMISPPSDVVSVLAASLHGSPAGGSTRPSGWAGTVGWSSARSLGSSVVVALACATSDAPTSLGLLYLACALICVRFLTAAAD
jgi:hypothetical protein